MTSGSTKRGPSLPLYWINNEAFLPRSYGRRQGQLFARVLRSGNKYVVATLDFQTTGVEFDTTNEATEFINALYALDDH